MHLLNRWDKHNKIINTDETVSILIIAREENGVCTKFDV